jgi:AraC-like DNA-binding protein
MRLSREHGGRRQIVVRRPLPGVTVARSSGGPLVRGVPDHYGATLHLAGRSEWRCRRSRWSSVAGTISVKVPGEVYVEDARVERTESQSVLFDVALVADACAALDRPGFAPHDRALEPSSIAMRERPLAELHHQLLRGDDAGLDEAVCAALAVLVDLACEPRGAGFRASAFSVAVARSRALLDERLTDTVTLDELAAHARLDKFQLCRAFREQVGLPPHAYVTHRRVTLAQGLLARGVPQAQVAASVGLYDQSLLHRHFKRILGVTPGAFVRALR